MWSDQLTWHWCHHEDNKISRNNICSSLYKYSLNLTFISGGQYCISCCVGAQMWQTWRSDAAFVQLRPENVLRQPTVGALCGCVVFGNQSGHSFLKCLVIQPAVYIFIYLISHVTSWQRIPPATCGEVSSSCVQSDEKKRLIPSQYRAMSHMIHPLSLFSHNLSHCVTGQPTMTQHIQLYCQQALHNDQWAREQTVPRFVCWSATFSGSTLFTDAEVCENALVRCPPVSCPCRKYEADCWIQSVQLKVWKHLKKCNNEL